MPIAEYGKCQYCGKKCNEGSFTCQPCANEYYKDATIGDTTGQRDNHNNWYED